MNIDEIFKIAERLWPAFLEKHKDELNGKEGIRFAVKERISANPREIVSKTIGILPAEKVDEKTFYSHEKITRLERRRIAGYDDVCSFESANEENKEFGGAILGHNYFLSGSNLPPELDQDFVIEVGLESDELTRNEADYIYIISEPMRKKKELV